MQKPLALMQTNLGAAECQEGHNGVCHRALREISSRRKTHGLFRCWACGSCREKKSLKIGGFFFFLRRSKRRIGIGLGTLLLTDLVGEVGEHVEGAGVMG